MTARRRIASRPSPAMVVAALALVAAMAGTAMAGPDAFTSAITKKKVKKIANKQIDQRLPWGSADLGADSVTGDQVDDGSLENGDLGQVSTGSVDIGSIPGGSCVNGANLPIPGADPQDLLIVTPAGVGSGVPESNFDNNGELIMTGIPHPGESHIKVCNVSGGAIDPGTVNWTAILIEG